jgi:hypothetical protein
MKSQKRYYISDLICQYLVSQGSRQVEVTARDIVNYYQLPSTFRYSIAALLKRVFDNGIRDPRYGFYVVKVRDMKKNKRPRTYTIKLIQAKSSSSEL